MNDDEESVGNEKKEKNREKITILKYKCRSILRKIGLMNIKQKLIKFKMNF